MLNTVSSCLISDLCLTKHGLILPDQWSVPDWPRSHLAWSVICAWLNTVSSCLISDQCLTKHGLILPDQWSVPGWTRSHLAWSVISAWLNTFSSCLISDQCLAEHGLIWPDQCQCLAEHGLILPDQWSVPGWTRSHLAWSVISAWLNTVSSCLISDQCLAQAEHGLTFTDHLQYIAEQSLTLPDQCRACHRCTPYTDWTLHHRNIRPGTPHSWNPEHR